MNKIEQIPVTDEEINRAITALDEAIAPQIAEALNELLGADESGEKRKNFLYLCFYCRTGSLLTGGKI